MISPSVRVASARRGITASPTERPGSATSRRTTPIGAQQRIKIGESSAHRGDSSARPTSARSTRLDGRRSQGRLCPICALASGALAAIVQFQHVMPHHRPQTAQRAPWRGPRRAARRVSHRRRQSHHERLPADWQSPEGGRRLGCHRLVPHLARVGRSDTPDDRRMPQEREVPPY